LDQGIEYEACAVYSSASESDYWGWRDTPHCAPGKLAEVFLEKLPVLAAMGYGQDWLYAGWFQHMFRETHPDSIPVAFEDFNAAGGFRHDLL
jgi:hypothetical protein